MMVVNVENIEPSHNSDVVVIHQKELPQRISDYVEMLSKEHPFNKDVVFDKRDALREIIGFWPNLPKWEVEAHKVRALISNAVQSVSAVGTNERVLLQIRVRSDSSASNTHVESDEAMAVVAFDGVKGDVKSFLVPPMAEVPDLEAEKSLSGILVLCQPFQKLISKEHDSHLYGAKAGALYTSRTLDHPLSTNTFLGNSFDAERIEQEKRTLLDIDNNARLAAAAALTAIAIGEASLLDKTNFEARELENQRSEDAERLTAKQQKQIALRTLPPVADNTVIVAEPAERALIIKTQRTDHDPAQVIDARHGSTQDPLPNVDPSGVAREEPLTAMIEAALLIEQPVSADDHNDTPDDGNRFSSRINVSGFERRLVDKAYPVAAMAVPALVVAPVLKQTQPVSIDVMTPQIVKKPALDAFPLKAITVLQDLPGIPKQEGVAQTLPQIDIKTKVFIASKTLQPIDEPIPLLESVGGTLAGLDVGLAVPSALVAQETSLLEEPHRPLASPVESVVAEKVDIKMHASEKESLAVEGMGSLEIVHFLASSARTTSDGAKSHVTSSTVGKATSKTNNDIHPQPEPLLTSTTASHLGRVNNRSAVEPAVRQSNSIGPVAEVLLHFTVTNKVEPNHILENNPVSIRKKDPIGARVKPGRKKNNSKSIKKQSSLKKRSLKRKSITLSAAKRLAASLPSLPFR